MTSLFTLQEIPPHFHATMLGPLISHSSHFSRIGTIERCIHTESLSPFFASDYLRTMRSLLPFRPKDLFASSLFCETRPRGRLNRDAMMYATFSRYPNATFWIEIWIATAILLFEINWCWNVKEYFLKVSEQRQLLIMSVVLTSCVNAIRILTNLSITLSVIKQY